MPGCKFVFDYDVATFLRAQVGGYRDVMLCVVYKDESGLSIIGEIQIQDRALHELKLKVIPRWHCTASALAALASKP